VKRPYILELVRQLSSRTAAKLYAEHANQQVAALGVDIDDSKYSRVAREAQAMAVRAPGNKWIPASMTPTQRSKFEPTLGEFLSGKYEPAAFVALLGKIFAG
jgi:hypothetical protein